MYSAQNALTSTRRALLTRIANTNGPINNTQQQHPSTSTSSASSTSNPTNSTAAELENRLPTTHELLATHTAAIATLTAPFGTETLTYTHHGNADALETPSTSAPLSTLMTDFAAVVAREECALATLNEEWHTTRAEIQLLAEDLFGKAGVRRFLLGREDGLGEGVGKGVEGVEGLERAVGEVEAEAVRKVVEVEEGERRAVSGRKKQLLTSILLMEGED